MPGCNSEEENQLVVRARSLLASYENMAEMIRLGAYRPGSDASVDEAIFYQPMLEEFLSQKSTERADLEGCYAALAEILNQQPNQSGAQAVAQGNAA